MKELSLYGPLVARGLVVTLALWFCSAGISLVIGTILGIVQCKELRMAIVSSCINWYVYLLRGIPLYVQLLIAYFVLPDLVGINISPCVAAIGSLGLCSSAYITEIVRNGINAVGQGQWQASFVLGYTRVQALRYIILPQAASYIIPPLSNELESMIKSTAILSSIGVLELTKTANNIVARNMNPVPIYLTIAVLYLIISYVLSLIITYAERKVTIC